MAVKMKKEIHALQNERNDRKLNFNYVDDE
jgi:hypothetical protein